MARYDRSIQIYTVDDMGVNTYVYDKNRRYPVEAGTRAANVTSYLPGGYDPSMVRDEEAVRRKELADKTVEVAIAAWESRWGPIPWDRTQIMTMHLTVQCLVEVRVDPA